MGIGTLMVETRCADESLPISGAEVTIRNHKQYDLQTDHNGQTEKVSFEAPDKIHTLDPSDPGPHSSTVEITVNKPGFVTTIVSQVPIFDGIDSFLPIHMHPAAEGWQNPERYVIPPPAVEGTGERFLQAVAVQNIPQSDPPTPEPFVLNEVVVPDYITVHLGNPYSIRI